MASLPNVIRKHITELYKKICELYPQALADSTMFNEEYGMSTSETMQILTISLGVLSIMYELCIKKPNINENEMINLCKEKCKKDYIKINLDTGLGDDSIVYPKLDSWGSVDDLDAIYSETKHIKSFKQKGHPLSVVIYLNGLMWAITYVPHKVDELVDGSAKIIGKELAKQLAKEIQ